MVDDIPEIIAIYAKDELRGSREIASPEISEVYQRAFFQIDEDPDQLLLVAENDGAVIGTLQVTSIQHLISRAFKKAIIEALFIDKAYQGKGIGTLLVEEAQIWACEKGCVSLELTSNKKRTRAHQFYRKLGFTASHEGFKKNI